MVFSAAASAAGATGVRPPLQLQPFRSRRATIARSRGLCSRASSTTQKSFLYTNKRRLIPTNYPTVLQPQLPLYMSIRNALPAWLSLGCSSVVAGWIRSGYPLQFSAAPPPPFHHGTSGQSTCPLQRAFWAAEATRMFSSGAWEPATCFDYVSRAHLQPKAGSPGKFRVCLDLKYFNGFLRDLPHRCETLKRLQSMLQQGDSMFSFDLQDGFQALAVAPADRKYLTFLLEGVGYVQLAVLPFGMSSSPFAFGKLMRVFTTGLRSPLAHSSLPPAPSPLLPPPHHSSTTRERLENNTQFCRAQQQPTRLQPQLGTVAEPRYTPPHRRPALRQDILPSVCAPQGHSRSATTTPTHPQPPPPPLTILALLPLHAAAMQRGLRVLPYVDDFLVCCRPHQQHEDRDYVAALLLLLGLQRNSTKGVWEFTTELEHLGIGIDSVKCIFFVTAKRVQLLSSGARQLLCEGARNRSLVPRKRLASFAGRAQSLFLAIPGARHWLRSSHDCIASGGADWSGRVRLSEAARSDLQFFVDLQPRFCFRPARRSPHRAVLHCDASMSGWGAALNLQLPARGFWRPHQRRHHITMLEAKAVRFAVEAFACKLRGRHVLLHEDNQAVVALLHSWSSRSPELLKELRKLWWLLDREDITIDARWISSARNHIADALSRFRRGAGWRLHPALAAVLLGGFHSNSKTTPNDDRQSSSSSPSTSSSCDDVYSSLYNGSDNNNFRSSKMNDDADDDHHHPPSSPPASSSSRERRSGSTRGWSHSRLRCASYPYPDQKLGWQRGCTIDRFADAESHLLPLYNAACLDPRAAGVDAFAQDDWRDHINFCNPDFGDLPRLAHLLQESGAAAVVVAPFWPAQAWFQTLSALATHQLLLPPQQLQLERPGAPSRSSEQRAPPQWRAIAFAIPAR